MRVDDIEKLLKQAGVEVFYAKAGKLINLPFLVYCITEANTYGADDRNFIKTESYIVELYSQKKDCTLQERVESLFDMAGIDYLTMESHLESDNMYMVVYYFDVTRKV